ncbi:MAG: CARDB domain-containing protein, partial [Rubripirellula sp.]
MTFPGSPASAAAGPDPPGEPIPEAQLAEVPEMEFFAAEQGGPADPMSAAADPAMMQFDAAAAAPTADTSDPFKSASSDPVTMGGDPAALSADPNAPSAADQGPTNMLRGGDPSTNMLRGSADAAPAAIAGAVTGAVAGAALANGTQSPDVNLGQGSPAGDYGQMPAGDTFAQGTPGTGSLATDSLAADPGMQAGNAAPEMGGPQSFGGQSMPGMAADPSPGQGYGAPAPTSIGMDQNTMAPVGNTVGNPAGSPTSMQPPERMASLSQGVNGAPVGYANQPTGMAQPNTAIAIDPTATIDAPGERRLEGAQTPSVIIQKRAPAEVKVGKPASFVIHVQNVGAVEALDVEVHDRVPAGMRLIDASPKPIQQGNMLLWQLGAMPAGDERTVTMQLVPEQEGELGSVARVSFEAAASVRTIATRPELKIVQRAPETVLIGQQLEIELEVSNPGTGEAANVVLQEDVPEGLDHPKGRQLDNALGSLAPGEVRNQVLRLRAVKPGIVQNTIRLTGEDGLTAEHSVAVQVVAPDLQIELAGPSRRFLERKATYQLNVANAGTADATNIEISVQLDRGFTFVSTDYEGQYDPSRHAVFWSLASLPAGGSGSVPLTLLPVEPGEQAIKIDAHADLGVAVKSERNMTVEGFAELSFAITNPGGPIELGAETTYEIHVTNSGSKADSNVRVQLQLPAGLELVSADAEAGMDSNGLVAFQPKAQLSPGEDLKYRLRVKGTVDGTHIVRAVVVSDHSTVPVTKEESTLVYADQ